MFSACFQSSSRHENFIRLSLPILLVLVRQREKSKSTLIFRLSTGIESFKSVKYSWCYEFFNCYCTVLLYSWTVIFEDGLTEKMCCKHYDDIILLVVMLALRFIVRLRFSPDVPIFAKYLNFPWSNSSERKWLQHSTR